MSRPRLLAPRRLVALAALLAVGGGVLAAHDGATAHDPGSGREPVFACDLDHGRATHVESAREVERHDCAACVHRLHSRGGAPLAVAAFALVARGGLPSAAAPAAAPFPPLAQAPSRGPPLV
jgi:hypothetical protein